MSYRMNRQIPSAKEIADSEGINLEFQVDGYHSRNIITIQINVDNNYLRGIPERPVSFRIYQRSGARDNLHSEWKDDIKIAKCYVDAMNRAIEVSEYLRDNVIDEANKLAILNLEAKKREQEEYEKADALERENDEAFTKKEANRMIRDMHTKAKNPEHRFTSGKVVFVPCGLDKEPFYLECAALYRFSNVYFYKYYSDRDYRYRISRKDAIRLIRESSSAKTFFARLAD